MKPSSPCLNCEHREVGCHCNCEAYKAYCSENAKINDLIHASKETDAQFLGYTHCKKRKKRKG